MKANNYVIFKKPWREFWLMGFMFSLIFVPVFEFMIGEGLKLELKLFFYFSSFFEFAAGMRIAYWVICKKYNKIRDKIANERQLICDGYADYRKGKQNGWLFFTEKGFEYYPTKLNFLSKSIVIPIRLIESVESTGSKLKVNISDTLSYDFTVSHNSVWKKYVDEYLASYKYEYTKADITEPVFNDIPQEEFRVLGADDKYVFISYAVKNQSKAEAMRHLLKENGIKVWMAPYDIPAGSKYAFVINDAIENCSCVLLLLSEDSQSSQFVQREIERAVTYNKTIIPMKIDNCELNSGFKFFIGNEQIVPVEVINTENYYVQKVLNSIRMLVTV